MVFVKSFLEVFINSDGPRPLLILAVAMSFLLTSSCGLDYLFFFMGCINTELNGREGHAA
jgi:hypothetical protein